jgi:hypothetical protein
MSRVLDNKRISGSSEVGSELHQSHVELTPCILVFMLDVVVLNYLNLNSWGLTRHTSRPVLQPFRVLVDGTHFKHGVMPEDSSWYQYRTTSLVIHPAVSVCSPSQNT